MASSSLRPVLVAAAVAITIFAFAEKSKAQNPTEATTTRRTCVERSSIVYDDGRIVQRCVRWRNVTVSNGATVTTPDPSPTAATAQQCPNGETRRQGLDRQLYCTGRMRCAVDANQTVVWGDVRPYAGRQYICERQGFGTANQPAPAAWVPYNPPTLRAGEQTTSASACSSGKAGRYVNGGLYCIGSGVNNVCSVPNGPGYSAGGRRRINNQTYRCLNDGQWAELTRSRVNEPNRSSQSNSGTQRSAINYISLTTDTGSNQCNGTSRHMRNGSDRPIRVRFEETLTIGAADPRTVTKNELLQGGQSIQVGCGRMMGGVNTPSESRSFTVISAEYAD